MDSSLNRRVALKVITSDDREMLERFQREAQTVADAEMFLNLAPNHPLADQIKATVEQWKGQ